MALYHTFLKSSYNGGQKDILKRNNEFLDGIDSEYFDYAVKLYSMSDDEKHASIALRTTLYHAMETMFSLLGAYLQSPNCSYAWMAKCSNKDLRDIVRKINNSDSTLFKKLNIAHVSWEHMAEAVFHNYLPGTEKHQRTIKQFALLWNRIADIFLDQNYIDEYNSIKHGFRIQSGGFTLTVGLEHEYGISPPPEEMKSLGGSEYGTTFFRIETIGIKQGNRSLRSQRTSLNWRVEQVILLIQYISMSITNITSALKVVNGAAPGSCRFVRPQDDLDFEKPWSYSPGVSFCSMDYNIPEEQIIPLTKTELLQKIADAKQK